MLIDTTPIGRTDSAKFHPEIGDFVQARENLSADWFRGRGGSALLSILNATDPTKMISDPVFRECTPTSKRSHT